MKKTLVIALVAVAALFVGDAVFACTQLCQKVPGTTFCRTCNDVGYFTGAGCQQNGPCGCFFVQVICAAGPSADPLALEEPLMSTVEPSESLVEQGLEQELFLAPAEDAAVETAVPAEIG